MAWRAGLAAVVLLTGACGSGGGGGSGSGDGDGLRKLPLGAVGSGRSSATMSAGGAAVAEDSAAMIAPAQPIEYRVAGDADDVPTKAAAYELQPMPVDEVRAKVAKALDVDADRIEVGAGGYDWYYNGNVSPDTAVSSSPTCAPDEKCADPSPPTTVRGVPSAADAEERVREILESLDVSLDGRFEVFGEDGFNRTVQYTPSVDGVPVAGLQTNIAFGADARIEYANGALAEVESLGEYPLVGLADAVKRLQDGFGSGGVRTMGAPEPAIDPAATSDAAGAAEGGASSGGGTSGSAGSSAGSTGSAGVADDVAPPQPACAPGEPCTSPPSPPKDEPPMTIEPPDRATPTVPLEPQVIEITGAELSLQLVAAGCPGDPVYLVPTFDLLPGPAASVIAVEDDAIAGAGSSDENGTAQPCPDLPTSDLPAGKPEPAPRPTDSGATEPAPPADSGGATEPAPLPADAGREPARP